MVFTIYCTSSNGTQKVSVIWSSGVTALQRFLMPTKMCSGHLELSDISQCSLLKGAR